MFTRFLLTERWYQRSTRKVKFAAFMPREHPETKTLETSVFQILGISEAEIWAIGHDEIASKRSNRRLHGRADIQTADVNAQGLTVKPDNHPPRHAAIVDWPSEEPAQIAVAIELAKHSELQLVG